MTFCKRQQKQFAIRKPLSDRTLYTPYTSASVERVFNNGGCLLGHTDASKLKHSGKCFHSVAINQENKLFTG